MWWWIASFSKSYQGDVLQFAKQLFSGRLPLMTKFFVMRECDNILSGYLCAVTKVLVSKMEFMVLNSSKGFWRSLEEISFFSLFSQS